MANSLNLDPSTNKTFSRSPRIQMGLYCESWTQERSKP